MQFVQMYLFFQIKCHEKQKGEGTWFWLYPGLENRKIKWPKQPKVQLLVNKLANLASGVPTATPSLPQSREVNVTKLFDNNSPGQ